MVRLELNIKETFILESLLTENLKELEKDLTQYIKIVKNLDVFKDVYYKNLCEKIAIVNNILLEIGVQQF